MKKISFYGLLAAVGLLMTACDESFGDWAAPQSNPQEDAITMPGFTASVPSTIDLNAAADTVQLVALTSEALPEGATLTNLRLIASASGQEAEPVTLSAISAADGTFLASDLQAAVVGFFGPRPDVRTLDTHVYADIMSGGQALLVDAGQVALSVIPKAPQISQNYYIVGGTLDWAGSAASKEQKFSHSGADVYEDPVFSIVINAGEGDTWFAIGDDEACDAIGNGDWSKLLGTTKGNGNTDATGTLDRRYNLSDDGSFCVPAGAKKIKVVINMMDYTYEITPVNVADNYYLVGGPLDWAASAASKEQKFSHSSLSVADDPVFTYILAGTGSETWFAIGDDEACDAIGAGDWSKLYGTTAGNGNNGDAGSLARRTALGDDGSFKVEGTAKFYRIQINMAELTYTITALDFAEYFYEIGNESGWSTSHPLYGPAGDGKYQGYYYLNGEFKFKPNEGDWNDDLEFVSGTPTEGTLTPDGGPNVGDPGAGFYRIDLDAATLSYKLTKIESVSIIGTANGNWDTDTDLTYNVAEGCWEVTTDLNAGEMKFRGNHNWDGDVDLGGSFDALVTGGSNIAVEAGNYTIKLYISIAGQHHAVVTKN